MGQYVEGSLVMAQESVLKQQGLYTHPSVLSEVPQGALQIADNIVLDRESIFSPRRGFKDSGATFGVADDRMKALSEYQGQVIGNYDVSAANFKLTRFDGFTFTDYAGDFIPHETDQKMKFERSNQNFYFTTDEGIKKLDSVTGQPVPSGVPKALGGIARLTGTTGFFNNNTQVAYRFVWKFIDANNNELLSAPSERLVVSNGTGGSKNVDLTIDIPDGITTAHVLQVYRSPFSASITDVPSDEMGLALEDSPSAGEITAASITVSDLVEQELRGTTLYTSPSQDGIIQANDQPSLAQDMALFKNTLFFANITGKHRLKLNIIAAGGGTGLVADDVVAIAGTTYTFKAEISETTDITTLGGGAITTGDRWHISSAKDETDYYVWYDVDSGGGDPAPAGRVPITVAISSGDSSTTVANLTATALDAIGDFTATDDGAAKVTVLNSRPGLTTDAVDVDAGVTIVVTTQGVTGENAASDEVGVFSEGTPSQNIEDTTRSLVRVINQSTSNTTVYGFYISSVDDFPGQFLIEERGLGGSSFAATSNRGEAFAPILPTSGTAVSSANDRFKNGLAFSRLQQPEAVPLTNILFVGGGDKEILRIAALQESLFIFTEKAIFRVLGDTPANFQVQQFDANTRLLVRESVVTLANQVYAVTDQGVVQVSENGVAVVSRPIEITLLELLANDPDGFKNKSFAFSYETDRKYVFMTTQSASDTSPTQTFAYNIFTNSWTHWTRAADAAFVNPVDDKIYIARSVFNQVSIERKDRDSNDFADEAIPITILSIDTAAQTFTLADASSVTVGDVIEEDSSTRAAVISVDTGTDIVGVDNITGFTTGVKDLLPAYPQTIRWVPFTLKNPAALKHFRSVVMLFADNALFVKNELSQFELTFRTERAVAEETVPVTIIGTSGDFGEDDFGDSVFGGIAVRPLEKRMYVPRGQQYGAQLDVTFEHRKALEDFALQGITINADLVSDKVTRI